MCRKDHLDVRESLADFPEDYVDSITSDHVLEHVHSPLANLRECRRVLRPGGRIRVATPNINSWGHSRFGSDWVQLDPPRHLVMFSESALRQLLKSSGFSAIKVLPSYLPTTWSYEWSNGLRAQRGASQFPAQEVLRWVAKDTRSSGAHVDELVVVGIKR